MLQPQACRTRKSNGPGNPNRKGNKIDIILSRWLETLPDYIFATSSAEIIHESFPKSYTAYEPMLLLPSNAFKSIAWQKIMPCLTQRHLEALYTQLVSGFGLSHLAINAPIPLQCTNMDNSNPEDNFRRLPSHIQPLHGDFGPSPSVTALPPTVDDFESAFWVTVRQNGITQIWAPLHTMFSRGNISEKSRILSMSSVTVAVRQGRKEGKKCTAVDLYAGVGYFAFSYVKAGVALCLCWEVSGWSVEGLRRGAQANKWRASIVACEDGHIEGSTHEIQEHCEDDEMRLLVFQESNEHATKRMRKLRHMVPPVRHVNCGLLPSSKKSWQTALNVLDPMEGGWLHLHENIGMKDVEELAQKILAEVNLLASELWNQGKEPDHGSPSRVLVLQNIERVKTYAPGVMHCVLDIFMPPVSSC